MARYQVILAYDGTQFKGFQRQAHAPTVQGCVEEALRSLGWRGKSILAAGRTDTGVHAVGQVIAFDLEWRHSTQELQSALNALLPPSIAARQVRQTVDDFHPRYQAISRRYHYRIFCLPCRHPLRERFAWRVWPAVELDALRQLSACLPGKHDFSAFGTPAKDGGGTRRTISHADWRLARDALDVPDLIFEIVADAFLYRMVRRLVYLQVAIAQGKLPSGYLEELLQASPRKPVQGLAPPQGLTLVEVVYPAV